MRGTCDVASEIRNHWLDSSVGRNKALVSQGDDFEFSTFLIMRYSIFLLFFKFPKTIAFYVTDLDGRFLDFQDDIKK